MSAWSEMAVKDVNLDALAHVIRETGQPVHVNLLARAAMRARLQAEAGERLYAPGAQYAAGETIRFHSRSATVKAVKAGGNPKQGPFKILTLALPDGTERHMAAEVPGAPAEDRQPVTDEQVGRIIEQHGPAIRTAVQEALGADDRFVWFQDAQGDHWCLAQMLPEVRDEELARAWPLLQGRLRDGVLAPCPTEALVKAIWGQKNDGSKAYLLKAFALNAALQRCRETRWLGDGWILEAEWQELQERPVLVGPREQNVVTLPDGVTLVEEDEKEEAIEGEEELRAGEAVAEDLEAWRRNRLQNATITLKAQHYYGHWLPLTRSLKRLFPPRASGADAVTFYHRFGGKEESFPVWVDWDQRRILGSPQMYQVFHEHGIYPGAKLVISHRGSEQEYEIRTKPVEGEQRVLMRRVFLTEDGTLEYEEIEEPVRYQIAPDVFVADARWEDLEALFRQAEEAGAGIFQLMYEKCCRWWEENDRQPLYVTAEDLFQAIHFADDRGRLTGKATIAWELWRRLAFEPVGGGRYLFRPEFGDRVRSPGISLQKRKRRMAPCEEKSAPPSFERTSRGQLVAADLVPPEPLFEQQQWPTATAPPEEQTKAPEPVRATPPAEPAVPEPTPPPVMKPSSEGGEPPGLPEQPPTPPRPERPRPASKSLFSTHYLEHRIQEHPEWGAEVAQPFARLRALYQARRDILPGLNEAQTETEFIRPAQTHQPGFSGAAPELAGSAAETFTDAEEEDMDANEAFETLLSQLHQALKETQRASSEALQRSNFSAVKVAAGRGEAIQQHIAHLEALQREWAGLIAARAPGKRDRAPRGQSTPRKSYRLPILQALEELGGRGRLAQVLERVYAMVESRLTDVDRELLPSGQRIRWQNHAEWEKLRMVREGLLASDSPHGIWEITEAGRAYLREHQAELSSRR